MLSSEQVEIAETKRLAPSADGIVARFFVKKPDALLVQAVRFVLAGGLTASLDVALLILQVEYFGVHYLLAGFCSFTIAVTLNYLISRRWVFPSGRYKVSAEFVGFFLTSGAGLLINQVVLWIMVDHMDIDYRISKLASIVVVTIWNFATKKYLIFRAAKQHALNVEVQ
jgi:putative flippase GtrA